MKLWISIAILAGLLVLAGIAVQASDDASKEDVSISVSQCGSSQCGGGCSAGNSCGAASCGATQGSSCGCGK